MPPGLAIDSDLYWEARRRLDLADLEIERHRKTLGEIARMRLMPDDKVNRVTLHAAIEIAKMALDAPLTTTEGR